jgi:hypothetical protein
MGRHGIRLKESDAPELRLLVQQRVRSIKSEV